MTFSSNKHYTKKRHVPKREIMNATRKAKIQSIGRVSQVLLYLLKPTSFLLYALGLLFLLTFSVMRPGSVSITALVTAGISGEDVFDVSKVEGLMLSTRFFCIALTSYFLLMCIFLLRHLKQLLHCFYQGDVFNLTALTHARKAYKINAMIIVSWIILHLLFAIIAMIGKGEFELNYLSSWCIDSVSELISLVISTLLLWAFELGTDLNEEAELTI
ncbi:hypothetical protein RF679_05200 [Undibacterium cyanobacteriorum]|uniref:DUF2975 domain-containing protein n=1 Tax=Undibacterium cyanobacteriorum TaxID=3073561 RepID=A0ABY9RL44_9BURK|nr:hypothetical protein [Undibacterium sp. 20NA77.5]WMW81676.1 hypothetical protein RF679_05200 [Undibacterium sp. 20NA77.5]